jgi:preprotein translocase subunit SecD
VGIICSMFTAIFITKTIFLLFINEKNRLSI